jgi:hypothetical protein
MSQEALGVMRVGCVCYKYLYACPCLSVITWRKNILYALDTQ